MRSDLLVLFETYFQVSANPKLADELWEPDWIPAPLPSSE